MSNSKIPPSEITDKQANKHPLYLQENMRNDGVHIKQDVRGEFSDKYVASGKSFKNTLYKYLCILQVASQSNTLSSLIKVSFLSVYPIYLPECWYIVYSNICCIRTQVCLF